MVAKIIKYTYVFKTSVSEALVYVVDFLGRSAFFAFIIAIYLMLWRVIFDSGTGSLEGFTLNKMIWYLIITEIVTLSNTPFYGEVSTDVKTGNIAYLLNKPYNYVTYSFFNNIGKIFVKMLVNTFVGISIGLIFVGPLVGFQWISLPFVILAILGGIILDYMINFTLALTAFWVEENMPFRWIYQKLVFTLGGMLLPLDLFPEAIAGVSKKLPFAFVTYGPAKLLVDFNIDLWISVFMGQCIYLGIITVICYWTFKKGVKNLNVNGG